MLSLKEHCAPKVFFLAPEQHQVPEVIGINFLWVERRAKHFFFLGLLDFQSFQTVPGPHVQLWSVARLMCNAILPQWVKPNCTRKKKKSLCLQLILGTHTWCLSISSRKQILDAAWKQCRISLNISRPLEDLKAARPHQGSSPHAYLPASTSLFMAGFCVSQMSVFAGQKLQVDMLCVNFEIGVWWQKHNFPHLKARELRF